MVRTTKKTTYLSDSSGANGCLVEFLEDLLEWTLEDILDDLLGVRQGMRLAPGVQRSHALTK